MRVVELLFRKYIDTPYDEYVRKYLNAKCVLDITEAPTSKSVLYARVEKMRGKVSDEAPISIFKASDFLLGRETILRINEKIVFNKNTTGYYTLREILGAYVDKLDEEVISSMEKYNLDRGRNLDDDDEHGANQFI